MIYIFEASSSNQPPQVSEVSDPHTRDFGSPPGAPPSFNSQLIDLILKCLRGLTNGFTYGARTRFVHSIVMGILFRKGTVWEKLKGAAKLAKEHGLKLGVYVVIYKAIVGVLKLIFKGHYSIFTMIAGCVGGHYIFGKWNPINAQIVMYLLSRNLLGFAGLLRKSKLFPQSSLFTLLAMLCWGTVMYLYSIDRDVLQNSLQSSMEYLYDES